MPLIKRNPDGSLPDSFFTPSRALVTGIGVAGFVTLVLWSWSAIAHALTPEPTAPPPCFAMENLGPYRAGDQPMPDKDDTFAFIEYRQWDGEALIKAEAQCTPQACDGAAWEHYRRALHTYMFHRMLLAHNQDGAHGEAGIAKAAALYDTPDDAARVEALRALHQAKVFHLKDLRDNGDAVAMLVLSSARRHTARLPRRQTAQGR